MPSAATATGTLLSHPESHVSPVVIWTAVICLVWYLAVVLVSSTGHIQLRRHFSTPRPQALLRDADALHVTIIRPIKGLEPCLYDCLASTFRQIYPLDKLHIRFCIASRSEPSLPLLERLLQDFPEHDVQILVEEEDAVLHGAEGSLGPNPKIRNMSRAYRETGGDVIWVIDCNVWVARGVCGRMVAKLEGEGTENKNKFVHQLPLVVDTIGTSVEDETGRLLNGDASLDWRIRTTGSASQRIDTLPVKERNFWTVGGGRLEEVFMSSAHAKFYTAINTVLIAPCIVGKSTMFRRSHLDSLTEDQGIDYFSENICEDHLIGDLLWKQQIPAEKEGVKWGKHALCFGDLAVQPMANMSLREYWNRRVRWLRVRKFTVTLATLVEPGTESLLCSLYGAFAVTTIPFFRRTIGMPQTWTAFAAFFFLSTCIWCLTDWALYRKLHSAASISVDENTPAFARPPNDRQRRPFHEWVLAWIGREALALPIWLWAFYGGTEVEWRGRRFWVGMDMKVHEIPGGEHIADSPMVKNGSSHSKARND